MDEFGGGTKIGGEKIDNSGFLDVKVYIETTEINDT